MEFRWRPIAEDEFNHGTVMVRNAFEGGAGYMNGIEVPCILEYTMGPGDVWYPVELKL